MEFRIADTFTDSLARLSGDEQKAVKTTAFDLQLNPANPGMSFHKLDKVRDKNFWSVRVNSDVRLIVHRSEASLLLCYVDHHDKAYEWAERRKLETHPKTGAAQLVEIRETVKEIIVPVYMQPADTLITKQFASCFFGTALSSLLAAEGCDTVLVTGATTSGCVRASAVDAVQHGYRPIVPRECVGDRAQAPHEANLFDIQQKYGDVVSVEDAIASVEGL